jgi:hypothetical protein
VFTSFTPTVSQWRQEHLLIPFVNHSNVRVKFQNTSAVGNNIYVDDINVRGAVTGIRDNNSLAGAFTVFPNPASGNFFVTLLLEKNEKVSLRITDALSREVKTLAGSEMEAGNYQYVIDNSLDEGIYFIILEKGNERSAKKLVITKE